MKNKYCGGCLVLKPTSEFNKRKASPDGKAFRCRTCSKKYAKWYREKYPKTEQQLFKQREYSKVYREANLDLLNAKRRDARYDKKRIKEIRAMADTRISPVIHNIDDNTIHIEEDWALISKANRQRISARFR